MFESLVRQAWGEATATRLRGYGLEVSWQSYAGMRHELRQDELDDLDRWLSPLVLPGGGERPSAASGAMPPREELRF